MGREQGNCVNPLIDANLGSTVAVRVVCCLTIGLCGWAVVSMKRCKRFLDRIIIVAVGHALVTHMLQAAALILGISFSEQVTNAKSSRISDYIYIYNTLLVWQELVAYLLLAYITVVPTALPDTAIMFIVVTWGMSATPAAGQAWPYFQKERQLSCNSSLWQPSSDDIRRLSLSVPCSLVLIVLVVISLYHVVRTNSRFKEIQGTCKHCLECTKTQVTVRGIRLIRLLIAQFVVISFPQIFYWLLTSIPSIFVGKDYEWIMLSVQGSLGSLTGIIVLVVQWNLISQGIVPCIPTKESFGHHNGSEAQGMPGLSHDEVAMRPGRESTVTRRTSNAPIQEPRRHCCCSHCTEHKAAADAARAEKMAMHAAASYGRVSSMRSIKQKQSFKKTSEISRGLVGQR